jgi:hypothetical protein
MDRREEKKIKWPRELLKIILGLVWVLVIKAFQYSYLVVNMGSPPADKPPYRFKLEIIP